MRDSKLLLVISLLLCLNELVRAGKDEPEPEDDDDPYKTTDPKKREPSPCEICKYFVTELKSRLAETDKSKEVIETGHGLDRKKRFSYRTSELRLTEALHEPHICENILTYNVHAERKGSLRYAKGMSETMQTLHGLHNKGVKVELGIPHELWDKPSAEVSKMHRACFVFAERYEEVIEDWYYKLQDSHDLLQYLCADRFLKDKDQECLREVFESKGDRGEDRQADTQTDNKDARKSKRKKQKDKSHSKPDADDSVTPPPSSADIDDPHNIPTPPTVTPPTNQQRDTHKTEL